MRRSTQNMLRSNAEKIEVILFTCRFNKTPNIEKLSFVIELTESSWSWSYSKQKPSNTDEPLKRDVQKSKQCHQVHRAHTQMPHYLSSFLKEYHTPRSLHSSSKSRFTLLWSLRHTFSFCAPALWNTLPDFLSKIRPKNFILSMRNISLVLFI